LFFVASSTLAPFFGRLGWAFGRGLFLLLFLESAAQVTGLAGSNPDGHICVEGGRRMSEHVVRQKPVPIPTPEEMAAGRYEAMVFAHDVLRAARVLLILGDQTHTADRCLDAINRIRTSLGQDALEGA
jgi:hypothetical protein